MSGKIPALRGMTIEEIRKVLLEKGENPFRATQVYRWIQTKAVTDWEEMKNIGDKSRLILREQTELIPLTLRQKLTSKDGTNKYLWELQDGNLIETVLMLHKGDITRTRNTLCLSTQVGCAMGCAFCATGALGFVRDLTAGEIVAQVLDTTKSKRSEEPDFKIQNLVYMGMGEPLENLPAVLKSIRILNNKDGQNIGQRRITVSTCGLIPQIEALAEEDLDIVLAISLHAPNNDIRNRIMPVNRQYPLETLIPACRKYIDKTGRRITFEYAMIKGINDLETHAVQLAVLLRGLNANVNIIPMNQFDESNYKRPERATVIAFAQVLSDKGINVVIREEKGSDIAAACGQLAGKEW